MNIRLIAPLLVLVISLFGCAKTNTVTQVISPDYRWMDRTIYFAYSNNSYPDRNNEFQKAKIQDALNEIAVGTSLGSGYFTFQTVDESLLSPITQSVTSSSEFKSFILIWPDSDFSDYVVNQLGGSIPDPNAITVLNSAYKRKFYMIFKASCFTSSASCSNLSASTGVRALVARQIGLMTGLSTKDCTAYPNDVMCANTPSDIQWSQQNKSIWFAAENNVLEAILMNPSFYTEFTPSTTQ